LGGQPLPCRGVDAHEHGTVPQHPGAVAGDRRQVGDGHRATRSERNQHGERAVVHRAGPQEHAHAVRRAQVRVVRQQGAEEGRFGGRRDGPGVGPRRRVERTDRPGCGRDDRARAAESARDGQEHEHGRDGGDDADPTEHPAADPGRPPHELGDDLVDEHEGPQHGDDDQRGHRGLPRRWQQQGQRRDADRDGYGEQQRAAMRPLGDQQRGRDDQQRDGEHGCRDDPDRDRGQPDHPKSGAQARQERGPDRQPHHAQQPWPEPRQRRDRRRTHGQDAQHEQGRGRAHTQAAHQSQQREQEPGTREEGELTGTGEGCRVP
jgi:hypothetical protein